MNGQSAKIGDRHLLLEGNASIATGGILRRIKMSGLDGRSLFFKLCDPAEAQTRDRFGWKELLLTDKDD